MDNSLTSATPASVAPSAPVSTPSPAPASAAPAAGNDFLGGILNREPQPLQQPQEPPAPEATSPDPDVPEAIPAGQQTDAPDWTKLSRFGELPVLEDRLAFAGMFQDFAKDEQGQIVMHEGVPVLNTRGAVSYLAEKQPEAIVPLFNDLLETPIPGTQQRLGDAILQSAGITPEILQAIEKNEFHIGKAPAAPPQTSNVRAMLDAGMHEVFDSLTPAEQQYLDSVFNDQTLDVTEGDQRINDFLQSRKTGLEQQKQVQARLDRIEQEREAEKERSRVAFQQNIKQNLERNLTGLRDTFVQDVAKTITDQVIFSADDKINAAMQAELPVFAVAMLEPAFTPVITPFLTALGVTPDPQFHTKVAQIAQLQESIETLSAYEASPDHARHRNPQALEKVRTEQSRLADDLRRYVVSVLGKLAEARGAQRRQFSEALQQQSQERSGRIVPQGHAPATSNGATSIFGALAQR